MRKLLTLLIVLNLIDFLETYIGMRLDLVHETNKIMIRSIEILGLFWGLLLPKLALISFLSVGYLIPLIKHQVARKVFTITLTIALLLGCGAYIWIVLHNAHQLYIACHH